MFWIVAAKMRWRLQFEESGGAEGLVAGYVRFKLNSALGNICMMCGQLEQALGQTFSCVGLRKKQEKKGRKKREKEEILTKLRCARSRPSAVLLRAVSLVCLSGVRANMSCSQRTYTPLSGTAAVAQP